MSTSDNQGGDNVHRGIVLGIIHGLSSGRTIDWLFNQLVCKEGTTSEIEELLATMSK